MSDRDQIIEAMARAMAARSTGGVCQPSDDDLEWQGWVEDATAALDAALPLIREALAEKVRSKALGPDFGRNPMSGADSRDARLYGAYDDGLECAARLIEEGR